MKRILLVGIIFVGLCGGFLLWRSFERSNTVAQTQRLFSNAFEADITLRSGEASLTATVGRDADGNITLTVKEPSLLSGMVIRQKGSALTVSYSNLEVPLELQQLPASSAIGPLFRLLSGALDELGAEVKEEADRWILQGESENGPYTVSLDRASGRVLQVEFPLLGFTCDFSNFIKQ